MTSPASLEKSDGRKGSLFRQGSDGVILTEAGLWLDKIRWRRSNSLQMELGMLFMDRLEVHVLQSSTNLPKIVVEIN